MSDQTAEEKEALEMERLGYIVAAVPAEAEFYRFVEAMDLLIKEDDLDAEDKTAFEKQKGRLVQAIQRGALVINDGGEAVYTPQHKKSVYKNPIHFSEFSGGALTGCDGKKKNQDIAKTYAMMGEMCGIPTKCFSQLFGTDMKVVQSIYLLLME